MFRVGKLRGMCAVKSIFFVSDKARGTYLGLGGEYFQEKDFEYLGEWIDPNKIEDTIKSRLSKINTIQVTTKEMFDNYTGVVFDCPEMFEHKDTSKDLAIIANADMEKIRHMFQEGSTALLLGSKMDQLEQIGETHKPEIRITHKGNLIGVIIDTEINY